MKKIYQNPKVSLLQTTKTVDWLINNTSVSVFDPILFQGYQRQIDNKHCYKIVEYIKKDFFLPSSIICALDEDYDSNKKLRIVDGQHRVQAFRILSRDFGLRYKEIKDFEISVIVMEKVDEKSEIDTFITINKTSKKVDTSLAFVLKNKLNENYVSDDLNISKKEYLSVELAYLLNTNESNTFWHNKILFEGNPKNSIQYISLNAFVRSTRSFLIALEQNQLINIQWQSQEDITELIELLDGVFDHIWTQVSYKWPDLYYGNFEKRNIIQGAIGFSSINRFIIENLKKTDKPISFDMFKKQIVVWINSINVPSKYWEPGNRFSSYSSESGYKIIVIELLNSML